MGVIVGQAGFTVDVMHPVTHWIGFNAFSNHATGQDPLNMVPFELHCLFQRKIILLVTYYIGTMCFASDVLNEDVGT